MSGFHTPLCRIAWTEAYSGGVLQDVIVPGRSLDLRVGWDVAPTLLTSPGYWTFSFDLIAQPYPVGPQFASVTVSGGLGFLRNLPGTGMFTRVTWSTANGFVTDPDATYFLFRPHLYINLPGIGTDQFAFPEVPHYLLWE
jgi:hypothetical protein